MSGTTHGQAGHLTAAGRAAADPRAADPRAADPRAGGPSRRQVLRASCAAGAAGLGAATLSACGGGDDAPAVTTEADGAFRVPATAVEVGSSVYLSGAHVIVTRPTEGDYVAFDATCPHQGCQVSGTGDDGQLVCPCHDSHFDPTTGAVLSGPAATGLTTLTVSTDGTDLVIRG